MGGGGEGLDANDVSRVTIYTWLRARRLLWVLDCETWPDSFLVIA